MQCVWDCGWGRVGHNERHHTCRPTLPGAAKRLLLPPPPPTPTFQRPSALSLTRRHKRQRWYTNYIPVGTACTSLFPCPNSAPPIHCRTRWWVLGGVGCDEWVGLHNMRCDGCLGWHSDTTPDGPTLQAGAAKRLRLPPPPPTPSFNDPQCSAHQVSHTSTLLRQELHPFGHGAHPPVALSTPMGE